MAKDPQCFVLERPTVVLVKSLGPVPGELSGVSGDGAYGTVPNGDVTEFDNVVEEVFIHAGLNPLVLRNEMAVVCASITPMNLSSTTTASMACFQVALLWLQRFVTLTMCSDEIFHHIG